MRNCDIGRGRTTVGRPGGRMLSRLEARSGEVKITMHSRSERKFSIHSRYCA